MSDHPLPPGLDLLWDRRRRPTRGPKPGLSVEEIVATAIEVGDREGLSAVSMARVAKELGFTTMSLYRYVASKDDLLALMWNASAQGAETLVIEGDTWRDRLRSWAEVQREMIDRHRWITEMPMATPPLAPNSMTFVERGLETLDGTPLSGADRLRVIGLISSYALNEARMAADAARAAAAAPEGAVPLSYEGLLRELLDEERFPRLHRLAWAEAASSSPSGPPEMEEFRFGLERILDGVEAYMARQES